MKTTQIKSAQIKRQWYHLDAQGQVLGRLASQIASKLIGKNKVDYTPHLDCGDYVVITNASKIEVTGSKQTQKIYHTHSLYPDGQKLLTFKQVMEKDPARVIIHAVKNMLPKNKLRADRLKRLKVFNQDTHTFTDKFKTQS